MRGTWRWIGWLVTVLAVSGAAPAWAGRPAKDPAGGTAADVPEPLKPWIPWVLHDDGEVARCPPLAGREDTRVCAWPARLALALGDRGGTFGQEWQVWNKGLTALPGDAEHWPQAVRVDGKPAAVVGDDDKPMVMLQPGHHLVTGTFVWETLPDALAAPTETGLLALVIRGRRIDFPQRDDDGRVFLGRHEAPAETDSVDISVYRKLTDDNPLLLTTELVLAVAGKSRELVLGRALPEGFEAQAVESELPLRFDPDGRVRLQVRPGSWTITLTARRVAAGAAITRPQPGGLWKEGQEVWVFEARPDLRLCDVQGPQTIDPAQTTLPDSWKALPAYAMPPGATLTLVERRRGDGDSARDQLQLARRLWLDFDGGGYTVSDIISGRFAAGWRLEAAPRTHLGRVSIDGRDQFITRLGPGRPDGVEIRSGRADISADSRIEGNRRVLPATGFAHDFDGLSATLAIPPGWRLVHASGADKVTGTWIDRWSLLDFFLLLVTALAAQRLYGWRLGLLALATVGLTITETGAPAAIWLAVLVGEAITRARGGGKLQVVARVYRIVVWTLLVGLLLPYAVSELRRGVHPASEHEQLLDRFASLVRQKGAEDAPAAPEGEAQFLRAVPAAAPAPAGEAFGVGGLGLQGTGSYGGTRKKLEESVKAAHQLRELAAKREVADKDQEKLAQNREVYDPNAVVQTGPGLPNWGWDMASFVFNGPVRQDQELHLYLAPPWLNLLLSLARMALLVALALSLLRRPLRLGGGWRGGRAVVGAAGTAVLLVLAAGTPARAAEAALPSPEMLAELKKRLLEAPACAPRCGAIQRMALEAAPGELRLVLEAAAAAPTAIPLPNGGKDWSPSAVRVDGKPTAALSRTSDGILWLALPAGIARVELSGPLPARDSVQLALPLRPRFVTATARGWTLDGLHEDGAVDDSLKLSRQSKPGAGEAGADDTAPTLPPFLRVERTLHLGLRWEVDTLVQRETPTGAPVVIDIPLLPGEALTTPGIRLAQGKSAANVSLGPDDETVRWHSTLAESAAVQLRADPASATRWAETWRLDLGPTWHAELTGIPAVHRNDDDATRVSTWRPWPGEAVRIAVSKPAGAGGQTLTIDGAKLVLAPSARATRATLALDVRSSRGTQHAVTLGEGVELESVQLDGVSQPIRLESDGRRVVLPIAPGKHTFTLAWHEPASLSALFRAPALDLGVPATNVEVQIDLASAPRWILWAGGPRLGPAVQFWSVVLILLVLAIALGRTGLTPLRWWDWALLGLGLSQLPLPSAGVVAAFLLGIGWRDRHPIADRPLLYDASQLLFTLLAVAAVTILFGAIEEGLVSLPDMRVVGNGSSSALLRWYQDRTGPSLPRPWMFSAPLIVYRGTTLAWSLWLAAAALGWARWVWRRARAGGWWQPLAPKVVIPPAVLPSEDPGPGT